MKLHRLFFAVFSCSILHVCEAQLPAGFVQYRVAEGLNPTDMAIAPDGRIFITEKNGLVRIVEEGALLPDPFLVLDVDDYNERGLGHIALHPEFPDSPYVYIFYTIPGGSRNRISRIVANGNYAAPGSEQILYETDVKIGSVHHGGAMQFGSDGKLYVSTGENGLANNATNLNNDAGKVLRMNPDGSIPADNPFYNAATDKYKALYAKGFRNPFSLGIQPETGRVFVCDVGGDGWEEINDVVAINDYGWPFVEGKSGNPSVPANYRNPVYNYNHEAGCAVVGAAFYPASGGAFPNQYAGKFFFADYCKGFIAVLNPFDGSREPDFITGIKRPVGIRISPSGDFYYLARAGLGGGTEADNTASTDGSLWRVAYTGSNAPFVFGHPKGGLYPQGETVEFQTFALGQEPLVYRWQKNGADIPGADSSVLTVAGIQLQDSASLFRCIIGNAFGADTSEAAMLRVTSNMRPDPVITLPQAGFLYRAGEEFPFAGHAIDPEEGDLPASSLTWKIDFHHDEHTHPALTPVSGFKEGMYFVQGEGEPDDHVWYRVYLTAKDAVGLSRTAWKEVYPQTSHITVNTTPPGILVNVDGLTGFSPYVFHSVAGLKRTAVVPPFLFRNDSVFVFDKWQDGSTKPQFPFVTPALLQAPIEATYNVYRRAKGFGLFAEFFNLPNYNFMPSDPAVYSRIDSVVNFEWIEGSPEPGYVPVDNFMVRWTGEIVPFFDDTLTLSVITDDGARLWVDDSLVIDHWVPQPRLEHSGVISLQGGRRYPIKMEYFEASGGASANLLWSSPRLPKAIVPSSQLYPPRTMIPNTISGFVWVDSLPNGVLDVSERPLADAAVLFIDQVSGDVAAAATTDMQGKYEITDLNAGDYRGYVLPPYHAFALGPGFGLNSDGYTGAFSLAGDETREMNFAFLLLKDIPTSSRSWSVSPNPGSGQFRFIKHFNSSSTALDIRVFDRAGKLALEKQLPENEWETSLDLTGMAHGVYMVSAAGMQVSLVLIR